MSRITNKTRSPLRIALPGGKTLHLGPGKSGQISSKDAADGAIRKRIDAGEIAVDEEPTRDAGAANVHRQGRGGADVFARDTGTRRSGDR